MSGPAPTPLVAHATWRDPPAAQVRRARYESRSWLMTGARRFVVLEWALVRRHRDLRRYHPGVDLVVEGFPGSANSYAVNALRNTQDDPLEVRGHLHAPGLIRRATSDGVPTVVLLRRPADTVASNVSRWPFLTVAQALRQWIGFHESCPPPGPGLMVAPFEQVTGDFAGVLRAMNATLGLDLAVTDVCWPERDERIGRRDDPQRRQRREAAHRIMATDDGCRRALAHAEALYARLAAHALPQP